MLWDLSKQYQCIDLSVIISDDLPSNWPSHMPFASKVWNYFTEIQECQGHVQSFAPYQTRFWVIDEHCGTHFDGPTHFIPPSTSGLPWASPLGEQTGDKVPLRDFLGSGVCLDMRNLRDENVPPGESPWIRVHHVREWEKKYGELQPNEIVLFNTGWDEYYVEGPAGSQYARDPLVLGTGKGWPAPDVETVLYLFDKGILCLGTDAPSMGASHNGAPVHHEGLSRGMRYIEMLTGLDVLGPRGFIFLFLPIKVQGSTGGPGRAVALIP